MKNCSEDGRFWSDEKLKMANRLFFRLYQCANMLHKTGSKAVEEENLTTQQWAVLGALCRPKIGDGMSLSELARYLMVSRQNLSGVLGRMEKQGYVQILPSGADKRTRLAMPSDTGRKVWEEHAQFKIRRYYEEALHGFSTDDIIHSLHYLLRILENMKRIDAKSQADSLEGPELSFEKKDGP